MIQKRWNILAVDPEKTEALSRSLNISPTLCKILVERGIETFDQARDFFRPSLGKLHDPWLMKDMDIAVARILKAFAAKEKILVFGDYDVDGATAVACMYSFLKEHYEQDLVDFYIPHRHREGYGISVAGIAFAKANGYSLVISLDCGIKSTDLIRLAGDQGIEFIVCDHHLPDGILPPAAAILNPKQPECPYPFKELCGCGVGFKLICALAQTLRLPESAALKYLDLVATATAADIVPMIGENRILAYFGLKKANEDPNEGIRALKTLSGIKKEMLISNLVFMIAPRINAAGRMDDARKAVQMFIADSYAEALQYAEMLHSDNSDRKLADQAITEEAIQLITNDVENAGRKSTVVYQPHWHKGVVGIVASRLIERYYRPTIVLTQSGEYIAGSARSVAGFNVYEAIHQCRDLLIGYGGHFYAAGLTMQPRQVNAFRERFEEVVSQTIHEDLLTPEIIIDAEAELKDLTPSFHNILCQMEPFGPENLKPVFVVKRAINQGNSRIVKEQHIRFSLSQGNITFNGIGFNMAGKFPLLQENKPIDIVFHLDENEWNDQKSMQLKMIDFRLSDL